LPDESGKGRSLLLRNLFSTILKPGSTANAKLALRAQSFLSHFLAKTSCKAVTKLMQKDLGNSPLSFDICLNFVIMRFAFHLLIQIPAPSVGRWLDA